MWSPTQGNTILIHSTRAPYENKNRSQIEVIQEQRYVSCKATVIGIHMRVYVDEDAACHGRGGVGSKPVEPNSSCCVDRTTHLGGPGVSERATMPRYGTQWPNDECQCAEIGHGGAGQDQSTASLKPKYIEKPLNSFANGQKLKPFAIWMRCYFFFFLTWTAPPSI